MESNYPREQEVVVPKPSFMAVLATGIAGLVLQMVLTVAAMFLLNWITGQPFGGPSSSDATRFGQIYTIFNYSSTLVTGLIAGYFCYLVFRSPRPVFVLIALHFIFLLVTVGTRFQVYQNHPTILMTSILSALANMAAVAVGGRVIRWSRPRTDNPNEL